MNTLLSILVPEHIEHLANEGFSDNQIAKMQAMGVRSVTEDQAQEMNFIVMGEGGKQSSSGIYFPFTKNFGQIRCDVPIVRASGKPAKYLTPMGAKAQAYLPERCKVVTEGFKDAIAGSMNGGIPTGAIAGVSHCRKALEANSGLIVLFDCDGWFNPKVLVNLFNAGQHLNGKIQLLPPIPNEPKGGLCEWFKYLKAQEKDCQQEYKSLLDAAMMPKDFLMAWCDRIHKIDNADRRSEAIRVAFYLAVENLDKMQQDELLSKIATRTRIRTKILRRIMADQQSRSNRRKAAIAKRTSSTTAGTAAAVEVIAFPPRTGLFSLDIDPKTGIPKLPKQSKVAIALGQHWRENAFLAWNDDEERFYRYESKLKGVWSRESNASVERAIATELKNAGAESMYSADFVSGVAKLLRSELIAGGWDEQEKKIPLKNGVLDLETGNFEQHQPGFRFRWALPYDFEPKATCQPIIDWMLEAMEGDHQRVQLLRAYLRAMVTRRAADLQRYLLCVGPGGSGKSTYTNLAIALIGIENVAVSSLHQIENNRFELAGLKNAIALILPDSGRYGGDVSNFKALTGGDLLRYEEKGKQQGMSFYARLGTIMTANEIPQSTDYSSGLERRRLIVNFKNSIPLNKQRDLLIITRKGTTGEFSGLMPGLLNWCLQMPDSNMVALLKDTKNLVPSMATAMRQSIVDTNPIAAWLDDRIVLDLQSRTPIGTDRRDMADVWLYANYSQYSEETGSNKVSLKRFSGLLLDLLKNQLRVDADKVTERAGSYIRGVAIRTIGLHDDYLPPITGMDCGGSAVDCGGSAVDCAVGQTLTAVDCGGCGGLFEVQSRENEKNKNNGDTNQEPPLFFKKSDISPCGIAINPPHPPQSTAARIPATTNPPHNPPQSTAKAPKQHARLENGKLRSDSDPFWLGIEKGTADNVATCKNRALQIRNQLLKADSKVELEKVKARWSAERVRFVWNRVLTASDRKSIDLLCSTKQSTIDYLEPADETEYSDE